MKKITSEELNDKITDLKISLESLMDDVNDIWSDIDEFSFAKLDSAFSKISYDILDLNEMINEFDGKFAAKAMINEFASEIVKCGSLDDMPLSTLANLPSMMNLNLKMINTITEEFIKDQLRQLKDLQKREASASQKKTAKKKTTKVQAIKLNDATLHV